MENLVTTFLWFQNQIKVYHWQTYSFAEHKAFDGLYDSLSDEIDEFVETLMGKYGRVNAADSFKFQLQNYKSSNYMDIIDSFNNFLINTVPTFIDSRKDSDLLNIRDSILGEVNRVKYLLTLK